MFRLRAYGGLSLERDGVPYAGPASQRRRLAVLAVLAASDVGVSRDRLADYFWPDADPARGRHSLDGALSGLRRELRSDDLFVGVATLRLNAEVLASDLAEQAAALAAGDTERAAALYGGPFLDGFYVPGADLFERWVEGERSRRARAQARVLEELAAAAAAVGDGAAAVRWHQLRVALDPLDTTATLGLLRALTAAGNPGEALRLARVHEALVRGELDTTPGAGWVAAVADLRAGLASPLVSSVAAASSTVGITSEPAIAVVHGSDGATPVDATVAAVGSAAHSIERLPAAADEARARAPDARPPSRRWWPARVMLAASALLIVGLVGLGAFTRRRALLPGAAAVPPVGALVRRASVAVLPFANTSGDSADEHFSDGLTDELIGALSKVPGLKVTGHTSAFALKGRGLSVRTVADTLGVTTVLEGSVRRAGDRLRVSAQLVSAADNSVLWSASYDGRPTDVFAVQEQIARAIVGALAPALGGGPAQVGAIQRRDLATYELYLEGRYFLGRRSADDLRRAATYFERAVARDTSYAQAYAGLADARMLLVLLADGPPRVQVPLAREAAATALRLDSTLAEAHATLGSIREAFDWDPSGADREFAHAIALDPSYATAHVYHGISLLNRGRFEEAVAELTRARTLDPLSAAVRMQLGRAYVALHRPEEAVELLRAAAELSPEFAATHVQLGDAYLERGDTADALTAFRRAAALSGARDSAHLAYALAASGQRHEAEGILGALLVASRHRYLPPVPMAKAYAALNDADAAFASLERGYEERAAQMRTIMVTPAFAPLHADRRWLPLLRRIGLAP